MVPYGDTALPGIALLTGPFASKTSRSSFRDFDAKSRQRGHGRGACAIGLAAGMLGNGIGFLPLVIVGGPDWPPHLHPMGRAPSTDFSVTS